jgi:3-isopropylmalate dehydrogenase
MASVQHVDQACNVLDAFCEKFELESVPVGGVGYAVHGLTLLEGTLKLAKQADTILFGAVCDWQSDIMERSLRPEQAILGLRKHLGLFANLRPAILYSELANASTLNSEVVSGSDTMIIRELTGNLYFCQPRGIRTAPDGAFKGEREGFDTMRYAESKIRRIAHVAFKAARKRGKRRASVDKANVLETSQFWRDIVTDVHKEYSDAALDRHACRRRSDVTGTRAEEIRCHRHR